MKSKSLFVSLFFVVALAVGGVWPVLAGVTPPSVEVTLNPGESYTVTKTVDVPAVPPIVDVVFAVDLTGSMGGELANVKIHLTNIINTLAALPGVNLQVGVVSHEDYPKYYSSCGYASTYGSTGKPDSPFRLDQPVTSSFAAAQAAVNTMTLGSGSDGPESYTRVLWESAQADSGIGYRAGAFKLLVFFLDNVPHDCNLNEGYTGGTLITGVDPGRNAVIDGYLGAGGDDIDLQNHALADMIAKNVRLITMFSGGAGTFNYWQYWSGLTGGSAVQLDSSGNPPAGVSLADVVKNEVMKAGAAPVTITPQAVGCAPLVVSFSPTSVGPVTPPTTVSFTETITVPAGTPPGDYTCTVNFLANGSIIGTQTIIVHVPAPPTPTATATPIPRETPTPTPTATPIPTARQWMTGGGSVVEGSGRTAKRYTHGFELQGQLGAGPNNFQFNDHDKNGKFHLETVSSVAASDDSTIDPNPPGASFDTLKVTGTGRWNGVSGYKIELVVTDAGEPGRKDYLSVKITDSVGAPVSSVAGTLTSGNHQAHQQ